MHPPFFTFVTGGELGTPENIALSTAIYCPKPTGGRGVEIAIPRRTQVGIDTESTNVSVDQVTANNMASLDVILSV